jgi:hypothetical protein
MISLVPLALLAATASSLDGAFGHSLGKPPGTRVERCEDKGTERAMQMFVCPGDAFFKQVYVTTLHGHNFMISGSRDYQGPDVDKLSANCLNELAALKDLLRAKYPLVKEARTVRDKSFKLSDSVTAHGHGVGRRVEGSCDPIYSTLDKSKQTGLTLWLSYSIGSDEHAEIERSARRRNLQEKGLDVTKL